MTATLTAVGRLVRRLIPLPGGVDEFDEDSISHMPQFIILSALGVNAVCYWLVAKKDGNFVNVLTPIVFFQIPAFYVIELAYLQNFGANGSDYAYLICYAIYASVTVGVTTGYLWNSRFRLRDIFPRGLGMVVPKIEWVLLIGGLLLFLPIMYEYSEFLTDPRTIYAETRVGFGGWFFLSTVFVYLAVVYGRFNMVGRNRSRLALYLIAFVLTYLHGSKAQLLTLIFLIVYHDRFIALRRYTKREIVTGLALSIAFVLLLFFLTSSEEALADGLLSSVVTYSDYTRNSLLVVDDPGLQLQWGRLGLENFVFSLVPRSVFPWKPDDFGTFWLAARYFPDRFELKTGAPAFGIGTLYADFGAASIVVALLSSMLGGALMRLLVDRLRARPDPGMLVILLLLMDVPVIPIGVPIPLPAVYVLGCIVHILGRNVAAPPNGFARWQQRQWTWSPGLTRSGRRRRA